MSATYGHQSDAYDQAQAVAPAPEPSRAPFCPLSDVPCDQCVGCNANRGLLASLAAVIDLLTEPPRIKFDPNGRAAVTRGRR